MKKYKIMLLLSLCLILIISSIDAARINSSNYNQSIIVSSGGETNITSPSYTQGITIGSIMGNISSPNYNNELGFFFATSSDNATPIINATINNTSPKRFEVINITANATDNNGLSLGQIITNQTGANVIYNFSLIGTNSQFSQNITIAVGRGSVINFTARAIDGLGNSGDNSTIITVQNTPPPNVTLSEPLTSNFTINRTPAFSWFNVTDADNDSLIFNIRIICAECSSDNRDVNVSALNFTPSDLRFLGDYNYYYNWSVQAYDNPGPNAQNGPSSEKRNITINSYVSLSLSTSTVNFGTLTLGQVDNTTDDSPAPFMLNNDGNVRLNVSVWANNSLWISATNPTDKFRYKVDNSSELFSFNYTSSITQFTQFPAMFATRNMSINDLNYQDSNDTAEVDIEVTVPSDETPGSKQAKIVFESRMNE